jgi:hypothetical protein
MYFEEASQRPLTPFEAEQCKKDRRHTVHHFAKRCIECLPARGSLEEKNIWRRLEKRAEELELAEREYASIGNSLCEAVAEGNAWRAGRTTGRTFDALGAVEFYRRFVEPRKKFGLEGQIKFAEGLADGVVCTLNCGDAGSNRVDCSIYAEARRDFLSLLFGINLTMRKLLFWEIGRKADERLLKLVTETAVWKNAPVFKRVFVRGGHRAAAEGRAPPVEWARALASALGYDSDEQRRLCGQFLAAAGRPITEEA